MFSIEAPCDYQFIFWARPTASQAGNIINLLNGAASKLSIGLDTERHLTFNISDASLSVTSSNVLALNTWTQCAVSFSVRAQDVSGGARITCSSSLNVGGTLTTGSKTYEYKNFDGGSSYSANTTRLTSITEARLGGINGQIDEFIFTDNINDTLPSEPLQGTLNVTELGGFGTGALGNVTIASDCKTNTYASITLINRSAKTISINSSSKSVGPYGDFANGTEVMITDNASGEYAFGTITNYTKSTGTIQITGFDSLPSVFEGYVSNMQIITVPNFNTLTINAGATVSPHTWDGKTGGIVAFRVKGDCTVNGSIITSGKGRTRTDLMQLTHAKLIDNFVTNTGGGIFIFCGGKFTAPSTARLGATWDGALEGGVPVSRQQGGHGGAGYGGAGGSDNDNGGLGGKGGVGGGGGGGNNGRGTDAGASTTTTGGTGGWSKSPGGTQGITEGANSAYSGVLHADSGGAGAGGNSGAARLVSRGGYSGANLILIANVLSVDASAISTGGEGGPKTNCSTGGGGTGFAYIAAKSLT